MDALVTVTYKEINWHNLWNRLEIIGIGKKHEKTLGMGQTGQHIAKFDRNRECLPSFMGNRRIQESLAKARNTVVSTGNAKKTWTL